MKREENFTEWYEWLLREAEILDDRYPAKGMYIWLWYGLEWVKGVMSLFEKLLKETGHKEERYPCLIPLTVFQREKEFFEGFESEAYLIDKTIKKEKLEEPLVVRPTSETAMYYMWSLRIRNYKQLPLKIFQTVNVFRCETKMTKPLFRVREVVFFNEAHTVHRSKEDADRQIRESVEIYKKFFEKLAIPYLIVEVPKWDLFPGAYYQYDFVTASPDGRIIELVSTINLGTKFARAFNIKFEDPDPFNKLDENTYELLTKDGETVKIKVFDKEVRIEYKEKIIERGMKFNKEKILEILRAEGIEITDWKYAWQTCYGISGERTLGACVALHSDDRGLRILPEFAPIQIVIVPILYKGDKEKVLEKATEVYRKLEGKYRAYLDADEEKTPGWKFYYWELKGVPIRVEIGSKDIEEGKITLFRRDLNIKYRIEEDKLEEEIERVFNEFRENIYKQAREYFESKIYWVEKLEDIEKYKNKGIILANLCKSEGHARIIEERFQREVYGFLVEGFEKKKGKCIICGKETEDVAIIGRTY